MDHAHYLGSSLDIPNNTTFSLSSERNSPKFIISIIVEEPEPELQDDTVEDDAPQSDQEKTVEEDTQDDEEFADLKWESMVVFFHKDVPEAMKKRISPNITRALGAVQGAPGKKMTHFVVAEDANPIPDLPKVATKNVKTVKPSFFFI